MTAITLLYDPGEVAVVREKILPLFAAQPVTPVAWAGGTGPAPEDGATVATYLGDAPLARLLPEAAARHWRLALLPHPAMVQARAGFAVSARIEDAVADLLAAPAAIEVDLLYCNGRLVLNSVVIGESFALLSAAAAAEGVWARLRQFVRRVRSLGAVALHPFRLTTRKDKTLDTAALGIVAVEHGRGSALARAILEDSAVNDGMLHALVLAPRSVLELVRYLLVSLWRRPPAAGRLPAFIGHIKTEALTVTSPRPFRYAVDGVPAAGQELVLTVAARTLTLIPGRELGIEQVGAEAREVFRVQGLPGGEALGALVAYPLPWIHHAATEEFRDLFLALRENARVSESYLTLMVLSTLLATIGLFANSTSVIIGAMILAPLMAPIISLSMGVLRQQEDLLTESARSLVAGVLLALACATALTWVTPLHTVNSEIAARLSPTLLDLGVAVIAGIAGAYAHARAEVARSLAGVAIAVALVPPLAVAGIGIGWGEWPVFWGAFLLFLTNLVGIVLAAALTFLLLGYSPFRLARRGLVLSLLLAALVSVPLVMGFFRMVDEHRIVQMLEGWQTADVQVRDVKIRSVQPLYLSVRLLSAAPIDGERIDRVKQEIERRLRREIVLEAVSAVVR